MSYIFLQEQGEESSVECFSDIPAYVLSKSRSIHERSCSNDSVTECCRDSQSGTTYAPLTVGRGEEELTSCAEDSRAKTSVGQEKEKGSPASGADCGKKWRESLARFDQSTCLWKTAQLSLFGDLETFSETWPRWGIMRGGECWAQDVVVDQWNESGFGLPAPTKAMGKRGWGIAAKQRYSADLEANARRFGYKPHPSVLEWSMGWIPTWTKLAPLEMDKFLSWLRAHSRYWEENFNSHNERRDIRGR